MQRLEAMRQLATFDRAARPSFAALARVAALTTGARSAAVHLFDAENQHRVAAHGAPLGDHPASDTLCVHVVEGQHRIVCVDASQDERFAGSSFVQGEEPVRFYASVPIWDGETAVGTLCAWDSEAREIGPEAISALEDLALQVETQLRLLELASALGDAASRDPLTGVANRTIFDDRLEHALARRARRSTQVLVAVIDVDGFKALNDEHGHPWGDEVLRTLATRLRAGVRAEDTVARLGGDEFALLAELDASDDPSVMIDRLQAALDAPGLGPAVTMGWAVADPQDDLESVLQRADDAMYARKQVHARG